MTIEEKIFLIKPEIKNLEAEILQKYISFATEFCNKDIFNTPELYKSAIAFLVCHFYETGKKLDSVGMVNSKREGDLSISYKNYDGVEDDLDTTDFGKYYKRLIKAQAIVRGLSV